MRSIKRSFITFDAFDVMSKPPGNTGEFTTSDASRSSGKRIRTWLVRESPPLGLVLSYDARVKDRPATAVRSPPPILVAHNHAPEVLLGELLRSMAVERQHPEVCPAAVQMSLAFECVELDDADGLQTLLNAGVDINAKGPDGLTLAMVAILRGHRKCLGVMLSFGFDHSVRDNQGQSVFDYFPRFASASHQRLAVMSSLVSALSIEDVLERVMERVAG